jgi:citrate lyase beta subunit
VLNEIFQFIAANSQSLHSVVTGNTAYKTCLIIDLEDALQNILSPSETPGIKESARKNVYETVGRLDKNFDFTRTGIRINTIHSPEFEKDLHLLSVFNIQWACIVLPKIESAAEVENYRKIFQQNGILYKELLPVIETVKGLEKAEQIFFHAPEKDYKRTFWGHHDYNLDAGLWPFVDNDSEMYWQLTARLINTLKHKGYGYINGPITKFNNSDFIKSVLYRTALLCGDGPFDQAALSYAQVQTFNTYRADMNTNPKLELIVQEKDEAGLAIETMRDFEKFYTVSRSFALDFSGRQFISPHQYLCAKRFLKKIEAA